jgi:hypothetical protein
VRRHRVAERQLELICLGRGDHLRSEDELGQLAQVLGDSGEVEFVAGTARPAQP